MTPDLLTLIRRACEGTAAEGLAPRIVDDGAPWCSRNRCPLFNDLNLCRVTGAHLPMVCLPGAQAVARLAVEGATEVERLTKDLAIVGADLAVARAVDAEHLSRAERAEREVERLTHPAWHRDFWGDVDTDPKSGWCQVHPRRVQADTGEMIGGDGDVCLACEVERLAEALRVATTNPSIPSNGCEPTE